MVNKINKIILVIILLLTPIALADFIALEKEPVAKTNDKTLCLKGDTNPNNKITAFINNNKISLKLNDGTSRDEFNAAADGKLDFCIELKQGINNVKIESKGALLLATKEFSIDLDTTIPDLRLELPDFINEKKKSFTVMLNEPSRVYVEVNDVETHINLEAGNPTITIPLQGEFKEGDNKIKIRVIDESGNENIILEKIITIDTKKPDVIIDSVDDKQYTENMKADFAIIKVKGKTEPNINLKVINLFDIFLIFMTKLKINL